MSVTRKRPLKAIVLAAAAIALIGLGELVARRRFGRSLATAAGQLAGQSQGRRFNPPLLAEPIEIAVPLVPAETNWGVYPALGDLDGDGRGDLLVGGGKGRVQFFRNVGSAAHPQFGPPVWFDELCAGGRIPVG